MRQRCLSTPVPCLPAEGSDRFHAALAVLLQGFEYASAMECDLWQFAVEAAELRAAGLTNADLRWLECSGFVDHAVEKTQAGNAQRVFRPAANLALVPTSCFVLCPAAVTPVRHNIAVFSDAHAAHQQTLRQELQRAQKPPHWDAAGHTLHWRGRLVKRFRLDAANQQTVLQSFQDKDWAHCILVVLPESPEVGLKAWLHDTLKNLNRSLRPHLHFTYAASQVAWHALDDLPK